MNILVIRNWSTPYSKCGLIELDGSFFCYSLEREEGVCIAAGGPYEVVLDQSFHFNETAPSWYVRAGREVPHIGGVEGRSGLEIHPANWATELKGCLAPGTDHYEDYPYPGTNIRAGAVMGSDMAFAQLMARIRAAKDAVQITFQENPI